jgi:Yip1 domain
VTANVMLESIMGIAYALLVIPTEPIRPLQDVWLRPRRVFRELSAQPVGRIDQLLGAAQGMVGWLAWSRAQNAGATDSLAQIFGMALVIGSVVGLISLYVMGAVYARLGSRAGRPSVRRQIIHVLAYGGVPMAASLGIWVLTALLVGETTFVQAPHQDVEGFVTLMLRAQFLSYVLLMVWSVVLQVMGFSEVLGVANSKAFGIWVLGQLIGVLAALFLALLIATLFPG